MADRRERNKDKTVQDILAAARRLFSECGLNGTSIRDIETASGVSKGLILHHFGTKENLYVAVQDLLTQEYVGWMASQRLPGPDLKVVIAAAVRSSFSYTRNNREHRRITLWSYLEGQERPLDLEKRFTKNLSDAMRAGQKAGLVREDIDAFLMPFIIKGALEYWIQKEKLIHEMTGAEPGQPAVSEDSLIEALAKIFLK